MIAALSQSGKVIVFIAALSWVCENVLKNAIDPCKSCNPSSTSSDVCCKTVVWWTGVVMSERTQSKKKEAELFKYKKNWG